MGQAFDLLGDPISGAGFEGLDDPRMQGAPPLREETAVGHFVGEGVLEGVLALGNEPCLVQELGGLEVGEPHAAVPPRAARRWPGVGRRRIPCRSPRPLCNELFLVHRQAVHAGRQHRLNGVSARPGLSDRPLRAPAPCGRVPPGRKDCPPPWPGAAVPARGSGAVAHHMAHHLPAIVRLQHRTCLPRAGDTLAERWSAPGAARLPAAP